MIKLVRPQQLSFFLRRWNCPFATFRFPLPDLGEKIKEGRVKKLYVKEGDRVSEF